MKSETIEKTTTVKSEKIETYTATRNACKLCAPLGASLVFKGIEGALPLLHGSQGCATYIRRYLISHFKEPVDIACSNFGEETAIFGGGANLKIALDNLRSQYDPTLIGIATTCLSETIGDDINMFLSEYRRINPEEILPPMVHVSSPSYQGTHMEGFHNAVTATAKTVAEKKGEPTGAVNLFAGMLSPADLRYLKEIMVDYEVPVTLLPDYSETLDGPPWGQYHPIPEGGTPVSELKKMGDAAASLLLGSVIGATKENAADVLADAHGVPAYKLGMPIGIEETDRFFEAMSVITGREMPEKHRKERERLLDSYVDGHKYMMDAKAVVFGEEDLVVAISGFLMEIGVLPVLIASGGRSGNLTSQIAALIPDYEEKGIAVMGDADFMDVEAAAGELGADVLIGNSKGYAMSRRLEVPLMRIGFPIHDRVGGPRQLHVGYRGTQSLFDRLANTIIETRQDSSKVGYTYM
jgi:nitrogenase molybdenum-iron protein NifN